MASAGQFTEGSGFGQYRVGRLLGRGGMGEVYEVEHTTLGRRYALKLLPGDLAGRSGALVRFRREARVMANLEHPHIVRVDDFGETEGRYWLRMELVVGIEPAVITLGDYAAQRGGRIAAGEFAGLLQQMLEALAHAHGKGVVHRDLKPGNILLEKDATGAVVVKVSDFGLARVVGEEYLRSQAEQSVSRSVSLGDAPTAGGGGSIGEARTLAGGEGTSTRALLGTWEYMSPEQRRAEEADARSDVYAMGLICYRMLTGKSLGRKAVSELAPEAGTAWDGFIDKALEEAGADRYADGAQMLAAFQRVRAVADRQAEEERQRQQAEQQQRQQEKARRQEELRRAEEERLRAAEQRQQEQKRQAEEARQEEALRRAEAERQQQAEARRQAWLAWARKWWQWGVLVLGIVVIAVGGFWWVQADEAARRRKAEAIRQEQAWQEETTRQEQARQEEAARQAAQLEQQRLEKLEETRQAAAKAEAAKQRLAKASMENPFENTLGMKFVPVPGTKVLFCIWETRVRDYQAYVTAAGKSWSKPGFAQGPTHPAAEVSWEDAQAFCQWLTGKERKAGGLPPGQKYRLPTDAEWSVAVGLNEPAGGTPKDKNEKIKGVYPWGTQWPPPPGAGNYGADLKPDTYEYTAPVGSFKANGLGLYDLGGNVWEWCEDWYDGEQRYRVLRGGSWSGFVSRALLSSFRLGYNPDYRYDFIGFRVVVEASAR